MDIDLKSFFESSDNTLKNITRKSKEVSSVNTVTNGAIQEEHSSDVQPYHPDDYTQIEEKGDDKLYPVYINLFSNNTPAGKFIKKMTGTPYSHATVALDASMNNMYSFSALPYTKGVLGGDVSIGRESLWSPWYTSCEFFTVLVTFVDKEGRDAVQKKIDNFVRNVDKFSYNTLGCIEYYFGVKNLKDHDETTKNKWFCSEFVAACINSAGVPGFENIYMSPDDLSKSPNVISLGKYTLDSFDEKDLIKKTKIAEKQFRKDATLNESFTDYPDDVIPLNESASKLNVRFKSKNKLDLSTFKKTHITKNVIDKYPELKHVRCKDTAEYKCDGYIWLDKDNNLVCQVGSCEYLDDHTKWIVSLEIFPPYKGHGLSEQILDFATKTMKCKYLSVNKNNEIAKHVYDEYGFKTYQSNDHMYFMTLEYGPMNESVVDHIRRMKSDEVNTSKYDRCTAFVDWKKLYEEFRKVFPRTNPSLRFPLFELIIDKTVRPAKVTGDKVTSMIVNELYKIRNAVKEGFIQLIDVVKSLVMFNNQGKDIALHYPDDTVVTEGVSAYDQAPSPSTNGFLKDGVWNSLVVKNGKRYRERVETLILRGDSVFLRKKSTSDYKIPGGSTEKNRSMKDQAISECQEEARLTPHNLKYFGCYEKPYLKGPEYDGYICHIFVGEFFKKYSGNIDECDRDEKMLREGKFYKLGEVSDILIPEHINAIRAYHQMENDYSVTETVDPQHTEEPVNSMPEQTTSSEHSFLSNEDSDLDNLASMFEDAIAGLKDVYDVKENPTQTPANSTADESAGVMEFLPSVEPQREILTKDQAFENLETSYESLFEFKNEEANETLDVSTTPFAPKTLFITTESYHYPDIVHELVEDVLSDIESGNPDYADKKSLVWRMTGENVVPLAAIAEDLGFVQIESIDPTSEVTTYAMDISQYTPEKPSYMSEAARDVSNIFRADEEYIYLNVPYCEFYIPTEYFAMGKKFAEDFTDKINVIGLFNIGLFENDKLVDVKVFNVPVYLDINVYDFDVRMIDVGSGNAVECRVYKYYKDAIICRSFIPENSSVAQTFLQLIISGSMPGTIPYSQCLSVWRKNLELSGVSLGVSSAVMEMILAVMYRDAKDPSKKYCIRYGSSADSSEYDYMSASIRQICQYNSTFTGIIYEDIDSMITSAINRNRNGKEEGETPMEKIIKM